MELILRLMVIASIHGIAPMESTHVINHLGTQECAGVAGVPGVSRRTGYCSGGARGEVLRRVPVVHASRLGAGKHDTITGAGTSEARPAPRASTLSRKLARSTTSSSSPSS